MPDAAVLDPPISVRPISISEFEAMVNAGLFAGDEGKVELAGGQIIMAPHDGARHISISTRLSYAWVGRLASDPDLGSRFRLYAPGTVALRPTGSVRSPDALLCAPGIYESGRWPEAHECALVVETADTTLEYDDGAKRADYAAAGVPELWIIRAAHRDVRVCRGPRPDGSWDEAELFSGEDRIAPKAAPEMEIAVAQLFG
jgi:Uma2 family endonuclease